MNDRMDVWLDEQTLKHLKSISRKLTSPEDVSLTEEEVLAMSRINRRKDLPSHLIKHFLAKGITPLER